MDKKTLKKTLGLIVASQVMPFLFVFIGVLVGDSLIATYLIGVGLDACIALILLSFWLLTD